MRGIALFIAGLLIGGVAIHAAEAQNQSLSPNKGIVALNHVGIVVPDLDKAVAFFRDTMGFPEAFRQRMPNGDVQLVYMQVSQNTFVELQPPNGRPLGINHFGIVVDNIRDAVAMFKARGATVSDINVSGTKALLANVTSPEGIRVELAELPPESLHRQAMGRWH